MAMRLNSVRPALSNKVLHGSILELCLNSAAKGSRSHGSLSSVLSFVGHPRRDSNGRACSEYSCSRACLIRRRVGTSEGALLRRILVPSSHFLLMQERIADSRNLITITAGAANREILEASTDVPVKQEELSRAQLIWRAAKLPIYSVAIAPLSVGGAAAFWQTGVFNAGQYWLMFWSSILVITWLNFSNDAYDYETGVDKNKRESVVNLTGSQQGVLWAARACLAVGFLGLVMGATRASDLRVTGLLAAAIGCGYVYQCPPFRLSYLGLGEPLCFFAFGPLATVAFYLSQAPTSGPVALPVTLSVIGLSVIVGITTSLILFCSHFHQIEGDTAAGKLSPLVRIGTENGAKVVQTAVIGLYTLIAILTLVKALPLPCTVFSLMTLPVGKLVLNFIRNNHFNKEAIFMAKYYAVRLHVALALALSLGLCFVSQGRTGPLVGQDIGRYL